MIITGLLKVVLSLPHMKGFDAYFDLRVEQGESSQSNGLFQQFDLYANSASWHKLMTTKDLQPELLRSYLRLKKFDFVVRDKATVHTFTDSDQA